MMASEHLMPRLIKELPRSFRSKQGTLDQGNLYARSTSHSRTHSRDTGSRITEADSASLPTTSDPGSTNSTSAPSTPPQVAADVVPAKGADGQAGSEADAAAAANDGKTFRFINLPRISRPDLMIDPLAAARAVLNYSAQAQQSHAQNADVYARASALLQKESNLIADSMASITAAYADKDPQALAQTQPIAGNLPLRGVTAPVGGQNAFSVARMQVQQEEDECGPELTVYEHSVNKKKRKSGRVTYLDSSGGGTDGYRSNAKGDCAWYCGNDAEYPQDDDPNRDYTATSQAVHDNEHEAHVPAPRMVHPHPHLSFPARQLGRVKAKVSSRSRFQRFERRTKAALASFEASQANANGERSNEAGKDGRPDAAVEKKPVRRATKAESRAKARGGGAPKISLAALKAKLAEEQAGSHGSDSASAANKNGPSKVAARKSNDKRGPPPEPPAEADKTPPAPSPPSRPKVRAPVCAFTFTRSSPIASRLVAMRAEVEMLQSKLSDSLRPIDEAVAAAADVLTRLDAGEDVAQAHAEAAAALTTARSNLEALPAPAPSASAHFDPSVYSARKALPVAPEVPALPPPASVEVRQAVAPPQPPPPQPMPPVPTAVSPTVSSPGPLPDASAVASQQAAAGTVPPQGTPKISRRKKANMNNIHHRTNYVPSRMPSDPPPNARGPTKNVNQVTNWEEPPGLDHPTTTCSLFANEWTCLFCEYELLYGEPPSMLRACRRRKKLVGARKRAQDRAHRAAGGEAPVGADSAGVDAAASQSAGEKKKKKGKKKGARAEHGHECCTCTCGKEDPAQWEPDAPFANAGGDHHDAGYSAAAAAVPVPTAHGNGGLPSGYPDTGSAVVAPEHYDEDCETCRQAVQAECAANGNAVPHEGTSAALL